MGTQETKLLELSLITKTTRNKSAPPVAHRRQITFPSYALAQKLKVQFFFHAPHGIVCLARGAQAATSHCPAQKCLRFFFH